MEALKGISRIWAEAVTVLAEQVGCAGADRQQTLAQNKAVSLTLFAFDKGER